MTVVPDMAALPDNILDGLASVPDFTDTVTTADEMVETTCPKLNLIGMTSPVDLGDIAGIECYLC